jgi:hypothetical protein
MELVTLGGWNTFSWVTSAFEVELAIEKLKDTNRQVLIQFLQNWFNQQAEPRNLRSIIILILFVIRNNCSNIAKSQSLYLFVTMVIRRTVLIIEAYHSSATNKMLSDILLLKLIPYTEDGIADNQWGLRCNESTTNPIFCIYQILYKKWK